MHTIERRRIRHAQHDRLRRLDFGGFREGRGKFGGRPGDSIDGIAIGLILEDHDMSRRPFHDGLLLELERIRGQRRTLAYGEEAIRVVEDLNGSREGVLFLGPEEALILLPASRELDRELDLPGQIGGDLAGDGVDGSIPIDGNGL